MKKLTFFFPPRQDTFLRDIINDLRGEYDIKTVDGGDEQYIFRTLADTDICWFEWGHESVKRLLDLPPFCKYIVRLHSYELFDGFHFQANWNKVNKLIVVNDSVKNLIQNGFPNVMQGIGLPNEKFAVIYHGIKMDRYTLPSDKKFNKKVAYVGYLNYKKAPELFLQCFEAINKYDPEFEFHIAGQYQDPRIALYLENEIKQLDANIVFHGWVDDISKFYEDKDFVISTSLFESFQYSIAEGMARGLVPLVHNWYGSDNIYPREYIFKNVSECVDIVKRFAELPNKETKRQELRDYISNNFSFEKQMKEIRSVLSQL